MNSPKNRIWRHLCPRHPKNKGERYASNGNCVECQREGIKRWNKANPDKRKAIVAKSGKRARDELKTRVLAQYGKKCKRCPEKHPDALTIDHIDESGGKHRRELSRGRNRTASNTYRWLEKNGFPRGFQTLCFNCNMKKYLKWLRSRI